MEPGEFFPASSDDPARDLRSSRSLSSPRNDGVLEWHGDGRSDALKEGWREAEVADASSASVTKGMSPSSSGIVGGASADAA